MIPPLTEWLLKKVLCTAGTRRLCRPYLSDHAACLSIYICQRYGTSKHIIHAQQAKAGSCAGRRKREKEDENTLLADSDDAEARHAASTWSHCSAKSCARHRIIDRGRSDRCSLHHKGSCSRFAGVLHCIPRGFGSVT